MNKILLPGSSGPVLRTAEWSVPLEMQSGLRLNEQGEAEFEVDAEQNLYLVADASTHDFKRLAKGNGYSVADERSFILDSDVSFNGSLHVSVEVLEFAATGERLGALRVRPNNVAEVVFKSATERIVVIFKLRGAGTFSVQRIGLYPQGNRTKSGSTGVRYVNRAEAEKIREEATGLQNAIKSAAHALQAASVALEAGTGPGSQYVKTENRHDQSVPSGYSLANVVKSSFQQFASELPDVDGVHHDKPSPAKAAIVTDIYMYNYYKDAFAHVEYIRPDTWQQQLMDNDFDVFIYVTSWKGIHDDEWRGLKFREGPKNALAGVLAHCSEHGVPTVFQSIEDPSNFEYFIEVAEKFDYVFTSATEVIDQYRTALGHDRVFYGEYGFNPRVNHPLGSYRHDLDVTFFAGSYPERYRERIADMHTMFDSLTDSSHESNLVIADRNYGSTEFAYPPQYRGATVPPTDHALLQKMHKLFSRSLNFNSIKASPTMCAMRVYELQAQGRPVFSNYARSVFNKFPEIRIVAENGSRSTLSSTLRNEFDELLALRGMNRVIASKSVYDQVGKMANVVGFAPPTPRSSSILVYDPDFAAVNAGSLPAQTDVDYDIAASAAEFTTRLDQKSYGYVTFVDPGLSYSPDYLQSRLNGFRIHDGLFTSQSEIVSVYEPRAAGQFELSDIAADRRTTLVSTDHPGHRAFVLGDEQTLAGGGVNLDSLHVNETEQLRTYFESRIEYSNDPLLTVIIPVYNNGPHLISKCIPSLLANSRFGEMVVHIVDDGSTDRETQYLCDWLQAVFPNVTVSGFNDGGSGSASRPRNFGLDHLATEFVTFLDPDNEISQAGYDILLSDFTAAAAENPEVDFVSGYQVKVAATNTYTGRHASDGIRLIGDLRSEFFEEGKFPVVSTQACVMRSSMFAENPSFRFVENSIGQDTLFGWELLSIARAGAFTSNVHLIYYSERDDSVTNRVGLRFFERSLVLEEAQVPFLHENRLFDIYRRSHGQQFVQNWYCAKLERVSDSEFEESLRIVRSIAEMYDLDIRFPEAPPSVLV
ncbi:glycosyltransferase [Brevibacterium casei]|uniref:glycosyltransferase n=1 Tax=Brevibacterium casei TaxID=33889 RepID=UPI0034502848